MSATVVREASVDTLMAATTAPAWSRIGAARERSPDLQLLVHDRVVLAAPAVDLLAQRLRASGRCARSAGAGRPRPARDRPGRPDSPARSTRPIDIAYAGKRVPTLTVTLMIRRFGTRAT
jgi:hypothetical protein